MMKVGKLPPALLEKLLGKFPCRDPRVLLGPKIGEDASVIELGDRLLVAKTDPITFASDLIGWYAVNVNANDLAASGARSEWFLASLLLPENCQAGLAERIFVQIGEACEALGIALVGGHTEITAGLDRPIAVGCMLGETSRRELVTSGGAREGDRIVLAGAIAVEGTALLAREAGERLRQAGLSEQELEEAGGFLFQPGISVVRAAQIACRAGQVNSMHDPTEGGLATGLWEVAKAAGVGMKIDGEAVPVLPLCERVCGLLGLRPLGLIASGSLLITCPAEEAEEIISALRAAGITAAAIGEVVAAAQGLVLACSGQEEALPVFERDEVARFLEQ